MLGVGFWQQHRQLSIVEFRKDFVLYLDPPNFETIVDGARVTARWRNCLRAE
jgi:hypothetical protein